MKLEITREEGRRNDLRLRLDRAEIASARLSVANRQALLALPGIPRHREATEVERQAVFEAKVPIDTHLRQLGVVGADGRACARAIAISNRNLGMNHGHLAWQRGAAPPLFRLAEDPCDYGVWSCLTAWRDGRVTIEDLVFDPDGAGVSLAAGRRIDDEIEWATFCQRVLAGGEVRGIEALAGAFYDARHLLAFDPRRPEGARARESLYRGYPGTFADSVRRAWRDGVPRARYAHNAVGLSARELIVVQREGTVEEIGAALADAGAQDGVILDNGGSIACWVWWANDYAGGLVSPTVDYRPPGTSAIGFVLRGPVTIDLPGGSVSYSTC